MSEPRWDDNLGDAPSAQAARRNTLALGGAFAFALVCGVALLAVQIKSAGNASPPNVAPVVAPAASTPNLAVNAPPLATSIRWESTFESATQRAQNEGKPVMIDFYTNWCGVCKNVDAQTYPAAPVIAESQNFVMVKVDAEARTDLATRFGIHQYPTFVFTDARGNVLHQSAAGYGPTELTQLMQSVRARL